MTRRGTFLLLLPLLFSSVNSKNFTIEEFLTLTYPEKLKLDEFREKVSSQLPNDFMQRDDFLIRFLREMDFDLEAAEKLLKETVTWRQGNNIDTILKEDWSYFEKEYDGNVEGCDYEGQPVVSMRPGDWDIRREIIISGTDKFVRFVDKIFEELFQIMLQMQKEGENVTHISLIIDMSGFNLVNHGCPGCIAVYLNILVSMQTHYAGYLRRLIMINTPNYALPIINTAKYIMSSKVRDVLKIYGTNREEWQKYLLQIIPASQLSTRFGGSKKNLLTLQELRESGKVFRCSREVWEYFL